jgi:hypothetical protein
MIAIPPSHLGPLAKEMRAAFFTTIKIDCAKLGKARGVKVKGLYGFKPNIKSYIPEFKELM